MVHACPSSAQACLCALPTLLYAATTLFLPHFFPLQILAAGGGGTAQEGLDVEAVEAHLRGLLLKLQYADSYLKKLPPSCTFEVVAYTSWRGGVPQAAWVEEQPAPGHLELQQAQIVPIKSCCLEGAFQLQLYAES